MSGKEDQTTTHGESHSATHPQGPNGKPQESMVRNASEKYVEEFSGEAGKQTAEYMANNTPQTVDDMKEQAKGWWSKFFGCLSSV